MEEVRTLQEVLVTLGEKPLNLNVSIPGIKGDNGQDGRNGADGLSAYDIAQLEGFVGSRQEWLDSLKAKVTLPETVTELKRKNIYIANDQLDTVLTKIIDLMGDNINVTPKPLGYTKPRVGQNFIKFTGEPHFKVSLNGGDKVEFETTTLKVNIPSDAENSVRVDYYNLLDEVIKTVVITLSDTASDELDMGAFVKDVELKPPAGYDYARVAGTGKVYEKGVKLLFTELNNPNNSNSGPYLVMQTLNSITNNKAVDNVEVDFTAINDGKGILMQNGQNINYYILNKANDTTVIKIKKSQIFKSGGFPGSPDIIGQFNEFTFLGVGGPPGVPHKKIKINGSEVVEMNDYVTYTYSFDTDSITYDSDMDAI